MKVRGELFLVGERASKYFDAFEQIVEAASSQETWSKDSIDKLLCERLLATLSAESDAEISVQANTLIAKLNSQPKDYRIELSVFGLDLDCNGITFGDVTFIVAAHNPTFLHPSLPEELRGNILFAGISVTAIDETTALEIASSRIDRHLAVLNAICSDYPPSLVRISRTFLANFNYSIQRIGTDRGSGTTNLTSGTRTRLLRRPDVDVIFERHGGKPLSELIKKESQISLRIVSAFETAGIACLEDQPHISFLLFAIALESAVLGKQNKEELTLQLALRTSHLLSASMKGRKQTFDRVKRLYRVRSKIVHSGSTNVLRKDVAEMKYVCFSALYSLLSYDRVCSLEQDEDLENWFTTQLLDSRTIEVAD
jgi:hypothetical protein